MTIQLADFPETTLAPGTPETYKGVQILRHAPHGTEILNVDLAQPLADGTFQAVMDIWHRDHVICFRNQDLTADDQLRFGRRVGELAVIHTQQFSGEDPAKATILYAMKIPKTGGNTLFCDLERAYDTLDADTRARLEGLKALHIYDYDAGATHTAAAVAEDAPRYVHPLVRTHPVTGRKCLFVNRLMTYEIVGLPRAESDALLARLFDHIENPDFVYEHRWKLGDLLMWDNRCTAHARRDFDPTQDRLMRRLTVLGEAPV